MSNVYSGDYRGIGVDLKEGALAWPAFDSDLLPQVDELLRAATLVDDERITEIASHIVVAGGKRLRPRLVLACAIAVAGPYGVTATVMKAATAIELFHLSSLYHDDVLDEAELRRGRPSANALWGNERAVLGGDALMAHAYRITAELGPDALRRLAATSLDMCVGEIAECDQRFERARTICDYERSIRGKTAALLATSCWLGAMIGGAPEGTADVLADFGTEVGIAFQIIDDVLDLCGDSQTVGKPTGSDLREGVFTLPVLISADRDPRLADLLTSTMDERTVNEISQLVREIGGDRAAVECAVTHIEAATAHLGELDLDPMGKDALTQIAVAVLDQCCLLGHNDPRRHQ